MRQNVQSESSFAGVVLRLFWFFAGNLILCITGLKISQTASSGFLDILYWTTAAAMIAARFVDIRFYAGQTAEGGPATLGDWRRYSLGLGGIALGFWLIMHWLAPSV